MSEVSPGIRRLCRLLRFGGAMFLFGVLTIYVLSWAWPLYDHAVQGKLPRLHLAGLPTSVMSSLPWDERFMVAAISLPYLAALTWAFFRLDCLLRGFERGEFFDNKTVGHLRAFSGFLLVAKLLSLAAMHARIGVYVHMLGHNDFHPSINLSSDDMAVILMCALFFLIARTMEEGQRLAEENRGFV